VLPRNSPLRPYALATAAKLDAESGWNMNRHSASFAPDFPGARPLGP